MKLWMYAVALAAVVAAIGGYGHTRFKAGEDKVQVVLEAERAAWKKSYDEQTAITRAKEALWEAQNKERDDAWQARLTVAESTVGGLSARLRRATDSASRCAVRTDPAVAGVPDSGRVHPGVEEIERDADEAWRACAANTAKLNEVVTRYNNLRIP